MLRLLLVDRQPQLLHHAPHRRHRLLRRAATADHEIIGVVDDLGSKPRLVSQRLPSQNEPTHVEVAQQRRDRCSLRRAPSLVLVPGCSMFPTPLVRLFHRSLQPHLDQMQHVPIAMRRATDFINSAWGMLSKYPLKSASTTSDVRVFSKRVDMANRVQRTSIRTVGILLGLQVGLEDRFQDQHRRRLHDSIPDRRDPQRSVRPLAVRFGNIYPPDGFGTIRLPSSSSASSPSHRSTPYVSMSSNVCPSTPGAPPFAGIAGRRAQHVRSIHLVVQRVEPIVGRSLRFGMQRRL